MSEKSVWKGENENMLYVLCIHDFQISNWELYGIINIHYFLQRMCYYAAGQTILFSWQKQIYQGSLNLDLKVWTEAFYPTAVWFYRLLARSTIIPALTIWGWNRNIAPSPHAHPRACICTHTFFFSPLFNAQKKAKHEDSVTVKLYFIIIYYKV